MEKGENVTTDVLRRICIALDCQIDDIMELVPDDNPQVEPGSEPTETAKETN